MKKTCVKTKFPNLEVKIKSSKTLKINLYFFGKNTVRFKKLQKSSKQAIKSVLNNNDQIKNKNRK